MFYSGPQEFARDTGPCRDMSQACNAGEGPECRAGATPDRVGLGLIESGLIESGLIAKNVGTERSGDTENLATADYPSVIPYFFINR